jgi:hypothetical protein
VEYERSELFPRNKDSVDCDVGAFHRTPWEAVYAFFERWNARGLPQGLADRLRGRLRVARGRAELPSAGSIDSQSVKAADTVGATSRGFDAGKRINGRYLELLSVRP